MICRAGRPRPWKYVLRIAKPPSPAATASASAMPRTLRASAAKKRAPRAANAPIPITRLGPSKTAKRATSSTQPTAAPTRSIP
jgi:hypothetical protein